MIESVNSFYVSQWWFQFAIFYLLYWWILLSYWKISTNPCFNVIVSFICTRDAIAIIMRNDFQKISKTNSINIINKIIKGVLKNCDIKTLL